MAGEGAGRGPLVPVPAQGRVGGLRAARHTGWAACQRPGGCPRRHTGGPICQARRAAPSAWAQHKAITRRLAPHGWFEFPIRRAVERHALPVGANPTRQLSLRPVVIEAVVEVTKQLEPSVQRATRWLDEYTGRNTCERRVSLEKFNAEADPSGLRGRLPWVGK